MKRIAPFLLLALLVSFAPLAFAPSASAQSSWYVGMSGGWGVQTYGTKSECDGTTSAAYPDTAYPMWAPNTAYNVGDYVVDFNVNLQQVTVAGTSASEYPPSWNNSGTTTDNGVTWTYQRAMASNQHCALRHPYFLVNQNTPNAWIIAGGDIVHFLDVGPYYIGQGPHNGYGIYFDNSNCLGNPAGCNFPAFPSGTSAHPTQFLGANAGSCHNTPFTQLTNPTVLSGINGVFSVLSFQGSNYVKASCIEITQPSTCTRSGTGAGLCNSTTNDYIYGAGIVFAYQTAQGPSNLTLSDIAVIGTAHDGTLGSHFNTTGTDTVNIDHLLLIGNGDSGWNGDGGGCGTSCESVGTMNLSYLDVDWNGCVAVNPYAWASGVTGNAYTACYDDSNGGYGDGFVQIAASNVALNVTNSHFRWNTQDGFDSLHLSDDLTHSPSVNISNSWSEGNMGQTFKLGAGSTAKAINNVSISNCRVMGTASNFPLNPTGWNAGLSDFCRANGDQWAFQLGNSTLVTLQNNTTVGYGNVMYDFVCAYGATTCVASVARAVFQNNISKGYQDPGNAGQYPAGLYMGDIDQPIFAQSGSLANHNLYNTLTGSYATCPTVSGETSCLSADPLLASESNINAINPNLTSGSPARAAGITISGITTDFNGVTRPSPPSIGAFEFVTTTGTYRSAGWVTGAGAVIQ